MDSQLIGSALKIILGYLPWPLAFFVLSWKIKGRTLRESCILALKAFLVVVFLVFILSDIILTSFAESFLMKTMLILLWVVVPIVGIPVMIGLKMKRDNKQNEAQEPPVS